MRNASASEGTPSQRNSKLELKPPRIGCMCESLRPGMTVRRRPSITRVCGPRRRRISSSLPTASMFPAAMAMASTNEGTPFVVILALCNMSSADTVISLSDFPNGLRRAEETPPVEFLLVSSSQLRNRVLREFRGRRAVDHRVHVLDADPVGSVVALHDVHHCIVSALVGPIALPFEQH